ncbi:putative S1/P1 Nuclease [Mariniradius saccharolyticus AK6]|uniref:S1/P1 Nuclease n=1 Tax=Mariniradius saccharolyticus AK6 TaxID=1239962 RepID=M7YBE5_9BACT|nr:S1/P1 nuclease [Mariniradius saccharolyticus]EMS34506.1 putative S1/P1 Nuclease [Mariniradius saccharolyticus AK6]
MIIKTKQIGFTLLLVLGLQINSFAWGPIGHYVIGKLAEWQMKPKTVKKVEAILQQESISGVGVWMDNIRSDRKYDYTNTWHWVTTADGSYDPALQEPAGDAYTAFLKIKETLKKGGLSPEEERDQLRMLIHIVGDLHQPFHVGKPGDRGGNDVKVTFFNKETNIHAIWDSDLIEGKKMSYTEIATELHKRITPAKISQYQSAGPPEWLKEAAAMRPDMYDIPENGRIGYEYIYKHYHHVEERLTAAGIRLAQVLEEIYG